METLEAINKRASLKTRISSREIEAAKIDKILEAGRVAPSGRNKQPWRFIVVKDKAIKDALVTKSFNDVNHEAKEAPIIIVACANPSDALTTHEREFYLFDVALAVENIVLAATDLGLVTHLMTGLNEDELKKVLGLPTEVRFVAATPLAYPTGDSYDEAVKERLSQRSRIDMQEMVYSDKWGKPFK
ncbi:nitroreductase family protein [Chloroflexota bacterium]